MLEASLNAMPGPLRDMDNVIPFPDPSAHRRVAKAVEDKSRRHRIADRAPYVAAPVMPIKEPALIVGGDELLACGIGGCRLSEERLERVTDGDASWSAVLVSDTLAVLHGAGDVDPSAVQVYDREREDLRWAERGVGAQPDDRPVAWSLGSVDERIDYIFGDRLSVAWSLLDRAEAQARVDWDEPLGFGHPEGRRETSHHVVGVSGAGSRSHDLCPEIANTRTSEFAKWNVSDEWIDPSVAQRRPRDERRLRPCDPRGAHPSCDEVTDRHGRRFLWGECAVPLGVADAPFEGFRLMEAGE